MSTRRLRLDALLSERGLFPSRARAAASVLAGEVTLGPERRLAHKPGQLVADDVELDLAVARAFVSRGGIKLANALDALGLDVAGRRGPAAGSELGREQSTARRPMPCRWRAASTMNHTRYGSSPLGLDEQHADGLVGRVDGTQHRARLVLASTTV